jgi:hypothetical protein
MPGSFAARSSSFKARSGDCIGKVAIATRRLGCLTVAAEAPSLNTCESESPNAGGAQYTMGLVSEIACTSTRCSSIFFSRRSRSMKGGAKKASMPGTASVGAPFAFLPILAPFLGPSRSISATQSAG